MPSILTDTSKINLNFRIKVSGMTFEGRVHGLVGVSGLVNIVGEDLAERIVSSAFESMGDKFERKLRRGLKVSFYNK